LFARDAPTLEIRMKKSVECEDDKEDERAGLREEGEHAAEQGQKIERAPLLERAILQFETLGEEAREHEKCGEHVLAPHHPTNGFHVDREDCETDRHARARFYTAGHAPQQEVEETDIERVENDVSEVEAERIAQAVEAGIDRPTQIPHEERLFARKISDENFAEAREERVFVVEVRVSDKDAGIIETDELVAYGAQEPEQRKSEEHQEDPGVHGVESE
jgi:hypothetical protein